MDNTEKGIRPQDQDAMFHAMRLAAIGLGIHAVVTSMSKSQYPVLFIASLAIGGLIGSMLNIEKRFQSLMERFSSFHLGERLSTAILLFCIGTLSIAGLCKAHCMEIIHIDLPMQHWTL